MGEKDHAKSSPNKGVAKKLLKGKKYKGYDSREGSEWSARWTKWEWAQYSSKKSKWAALSWMKYFRNFSDSHWGEWATQQ